MSINHVALSQFATTQADGEGLCRGPGGGPTFFRACCSRYHTKTTLQFRTVANVLELQPWDLLFVDRRSKKNKVHTVFVSPEDIISRWVVAVNSSQLPPPPALSGGKSTDFLCLNGLAKDNFYMRKREKKILFVFLFFLNFVLCSICTTTSKWFQCYCALFTRDDLNLM